MTRLQQGARVEHIQVLGLKRDHKTQTLMMEIHRHIEETTLFKRQFSTEQKVQ